MEQPKRRRRRRLLTIVLIGLAGLAIAAYTMLSWDLLIPLITRQASSALGRSVTVRHLQVSLGRLTRVTVTGVTIANPAGFPDAPAFATADALSADIGAWDYLRDRATLILPRIVVSRPVIVIADGPDGQPNYRFKFGSSGGSGGGGPKIAIGDVVIEDGHVTAILPQYKTDAKAEIATRKAEAAGRGSSIVVTASGSYAGQPISVEATGGALLSLRDAADPYPIDLSLANGPTHVTINGTIADPLHFAGTNVTLALEGPDMAKLYPLTGVPIPQTPPYRLAGKLDYADHKIRFSALSGQVGRSDLEGELRVDPGTDRPQVEADLRSRLVSLDDLAGFIGTTPGIKNGSAAPIERQAAARDKANDKVLPDLPLNLPKVRAADVDLRYRGARIEGRAMPLDDLVANLKINDGRITLTPLAFGVGHGQITGTIDLAPLTDKSVRARVDVAFQKVDLGKLMQATETFGGAGTIGGRAVLNGSGASLAQLLGSGDGELKLFASGGNLSALLVDLIGLQFGDAVQSALNIPSRATLRCLVVDMPLRHGVLTADTLLVDTTESNVVGKGTIDLAREALDLRLTGDGKHVSIGTIGAPILIRGTLASPSVLPDPAVLAARGAAMGVLGVLLTPLGALIPTIQLGLGEDNDCGRLIARTAASGPAKLTPAQVRARR